MVCRSRDSIRESRSTKSQPSRRASSCPRLLFPEAMYPTRNTARNPMALHGTQPPPAVSRRPYLLKTPLVVNLSLLEADSTTERAQHDLGSGLAGGAKEGTSRIRREARVMSLKRKVVLYPAEHRVRGEIGRNVGRHQGFDIAGVGGEFVIAGGAEI